LIPTISADKQNRIVILNDKLVSFAFQPLEIKILLNWRNKQEHILKNHEMTIGQKWSTVVKAYTLKDMPIEEKEALF